VNAHLPHLGEIILGISCKVLKSKTWLYILKSSRDLFSRAFNEQEIARQY